MVVFKVVVCKLCCKEKKNIVLGQVYIKLMFNNIIVLIIDLFGVVIVWVLLGGVGFKGFCKLILYVVGMVVEFVVCQVVEYGVKKVDVFVKGLGFGCEIVICLFQVVGFEVGLIQDVILQVYNGCCLLKCCCV